MEVLDNNQVAVSGKADFTVNGLDADNYPHLPVIDTQNQMKLPVHLLTKLLVKQVLLYRCTKVVNFNWGSLYFRKSKITCRCDRFTSFKSTCDPDRTSSRRL